MFFLKMMVAVHVALFRLTGGRIGSSMRGGTLLLLTTTGNKSGKRRTVPVMYFDKDGRRFVIASAGGNPNNPAWFKNLQKKPEVTVEMRGQSYEAQAQVVSAGERPQLWKHVLEIAPGFGEYEKKVGSAREIPVVELKPVLTHAT